MNWMLKNSSGERDSMLTFAVLGAVTTVLSIVSSALAGSKVVLANQEFVLQSPDATIVSAFLGASLLAYVTRRNKKDECDHELRKAGLKKEKEDNL